MKLGEGGTAQWQILDYGCGLSMLSPMSADSTKLPSRVWTELVQDLCMSILLKGKGQPSEAVAWRISV